MITLSVCYDLCLSLSNASRDMQYMIEPIHPSPKCRATGKFTFFSIVDAQWFIIRMKWRYRFPPKRADGSRVKRRQNKKPKLRRSYFCEYCQGFHITSQSLKSYQKNTGRYDNLGFYLL